MRFSSPGRLEPAVVSPPAPTCIPQLQFSDLAARYRGNRVGGDFFEFIVAGQERLVIVLLDIAGRRNEALGIAATIQPILRSVVPESFSEPDLNEADAVTELVLRLNEEVLKAAGGIRCAPAFVACYNEPVGVMSYINAGHVPALIKNGSNISVLEASGLPLGLFSHATHDAQVCVLPPGSMLLLTSRGLLEVKGDGEEYGIDHLRALLENHEFSSASELCSSVLNDVVKFSQKRATRNFGLLKFRNKENNSLGDNDITTVALLRLAARVTAAASTR